MHPTHGIHSWKMIKYLNKISLNTGSYAKYDTKAPLHPNLNKKDQDEIQKRFLDMPQPSSALEEIQAQGYIFKTE